ncbi:MAG: hypothetical protein H6581_08025 [Bacteroidia bacterium]|nr:hypothetical protein [Bacteroidia bacterium]
MKIQKLFLFAWLCLNSFFTLSAQNIYTIGDKAYVDGRDLCSIETEFFSQEKAVKDLKGNIILKVSWAEYQDPTSKTAANPFGKIRYAILTIWDTQDRCEMQIDSDKELVKALLDHQIFEQEFTRFGEYLPFQAALMVRRLKTPFSDRKMELERSQNQSWQYQNQPQNNPYQNKVYGQPYWGNW